MSLLLDPRISIGLWAVAIILNALANLGYLNIWFAFMFTLVVMALTIDLIVALMSTIGGGC